MPLPMPMPISAQYITDLIHDEERFAFSRYNDGEWFAILGQFVDPIYHTYRNCDGCNYLPGLCDDLVASLENHTKHSGRFFYARGGAKWKPQQDEFLMATGDLSKIVWQYSDPLKVVNNAGELKPFLDAVRSKRTLLVGPVHLRSLAERLRCPFMDYTSVASRDCWIGIDDTIEHILSMANNYSLIMFAAGMATNVFIDNLASRVSCSLLDVGAMFDIYVGRKSRSVFRDQDWTDRIAANLA